ncbi:MAG: hypothetical protein HFF69_03265 [Oscillospiraceae bacterium]|jgi:hypothetical protein|nr:hypothetical protein [Oscillospiraceae bacterium]
MTDFMRWLYANYIKPQLDQEDISAYETSVSLMDTCLDENLKIQHNRVLEFYASHAFLLGLRTGAGLKEAVRQ